MWHVHSQLAFSLLSCRHEAERSCSPAHTFPPVQLSVREAGAAQREIIKKILKGNYWFLILFLSAMICHKRLVGNSITHIGAVRDSLTYSSVIRSSFTAFILCFFTFFGPYVCHLSVCLQNPFTVCMIFVQIWLHFLLLLLLLNKVAYISHITETSILSISSLYCETDLDINQRRSSSIIDVHRGPCPILH